jgi:large subunit ribosomal protein L24
MKIRKGDTVFVLTGKDKGRTGKVERVYLKSERVIVEGINMLKKSIPKSEQAPQGGVIDVERPLHYSNVMVVDPKNGIPSRVGSNLDGGKKVRVFKNTKRKKI